MAAHAKANGGSLPAIASTDDKTVTTLELPGNSYGVRQTVTVMLYHGPIVLGTFQTDLDNYQAWNYTTITPDDLYNYLIGVRATLPEKAMLITFDDSLLTQFSVAYPELLTRGMTATFYVIPNFIDGIITAASFGGAEATSFTWANAQTMFANGMRIQSHTMNHVSLLTLTDAQVTADFAAAKARIEAQVPGETVRHIAYPYGVCAATAQTALATAGVRTGRTVTNRTDAVSSGRCGFATPFTPRLAVPTAGTNYLDIAQANFYNRLNLEPELVPDFGFRSGAGKGWGLAAGASIDATLPRPGAPAGTKSLKQIQQAGSVSSSATAFSFLGQYGRLKGSVWVKTSGLGAAGRAFIFVIRYKADGTSEITDNFVTAVPDNQAWTLYTWDVYGSISSMFCKLGCQVTGGPGGTAWFAEPSLQFNTDRLLFA